jgi:DNA-binding response OmpR family regulator
MAEDKRRILIVEDDPDMLEAVTLRLEANGYQVAAVRDGLDGLNKAREENPDLVLLDIMLPKIDGFTICRMLKFDEAYKEIPVILFSARVQKTDIQRGAEVKADAYITKPFKSEELLGKIKELLKNKQA